MTRRSFLAAAFGAAAARALPTPDLRPIPRTIPSYDALKLQRWYNSGLSARAELIYLRPIETISLAEFRKRWPAQGTHEIST